MITRLDDTGVAKKDVGRAVRESLVKKKRERIGPFIISGDDNFAPDKIICAMCELVLATTDLGTDVTTPAPEELVEAGNIAVPNFGWFCGQKCAEQYSVEFDIQFARDADGRINYD